MLEYWIPLSAEKNPEAYQKPSVQDQLRQAAPSCNTRYMKEQQERVPARFGRFFTLMRELTARQASAAESALCRPTLDSHCEIWRSRLLRSTTSLDNIQSSPPRSCQIDGHWAAQSSSANDEHQSVLSCKTPVHWCKSWCK